MYCVSPYVALLPEQLLTTETTDHNISLVDYYQVVSRYQLLYAVSGSVDMVTQLQCCSDPNNDIVLIMRDIIRITIIQLHCNSMYLILTTD